MTTPDSWAQNIYIPRGMVPLKEAVVQAAEADEPSLPIRAYLWALRDGVSRQLEWLRTAPERHDPFAFPPQQPAVPAFATGVDSRCFLALAGSRAKLREALAEGELKAKGQQPDGALADADNGYWRTDDGANRLQFPDRVDRFTHVFLYEKHFVDWLAGARDPSLPPMAPRKAPRDTVVTWFRTRLTHPELGPSMTRDVHQAEAKRVFGVSATEIKLCWNIATEDPELRRFRKAGRRPKIKS